MPNEPEFSTEDVLELLESRWLDEWRHSTLNYHINKMQPHGKTVNEESLIADLRRKLIEIRNNR